MASLSFVSPDYVIVTQRVEAQILLQRLYYGKLPDAMSHVITTGSRADMANAISYLEKDAKEILNHVGGDEKKDQDPERDAMTLFLLAQTKLTQRTFPNCLSLLRSALSQHPDTMLWSFMNRIISETAFVGTSMNFFWVGSLYCSHLLCSEVIIIFIVLTLLRNLNHYWPS